MAVVIKSSGEVIQVAPRDPSRGFTLEEVKKAIGGGWIEMVKLAPVDFVASMINTPGAAWVANEHPDGWLYIICDEEGRLKRQPVNHIATKFYWACYNTREPIVGDVLLCVVRDGGEEEESIL